MSQFSYSQQEIIKKVRTNAGTACHYLKEMHVGLTKLRTQVSHIEYMAIVEATKIPQTKVSIVQSLDPSQPVSAQPSTSQGTSQASSSQATEQTNSS